MLKFKLLPCLFLALTALSGCGQKPEETLRVGTHPWPGYESLHLAESLGYYRDIPLRNVAMANASQCAFAMRAGTVDAATMTLDEALLLIQNGVDLRVILVMDISHGADVVMARPSIARLQDIRNKRVAVEHGAVGAVMLDATLEQAGLELGDIRLVPSAMNEHVYSYLSGKADVVVTFEPMRSELLKHGAHILFDSSKVPGRIIDVLVVRANIINNHPRALRKLVEGHFRALQYQREQPLDAAARIAPFLGVTAAEVLPLYEGLKLPGLSENHTLLAENPGRLKQQAADLAGLLYRRKLLKRVVNVEHISDPQFLPRP